MIRNNVGYRRRINISSTFSSILINGILVCGALVCVLPVLHIVAVSLSANGPANANLVGIWPVQFNLLAYAEVARDTKMAASLIQSVKRILLGVPVNMLLTIICAYPLSHNKVEFPLRTVYVVIVMFTMLFSGGLIPYYVLINRLHLMDTIWVLILPGIPVFNVIIMMNFFRQIPQEIREAASIDGAGHFAILIKIVLPVSGAVISTLTLFCFVSHWNAWFDALIFLKDLAKHPLQNYIRTQIVRMVTSPDLEEAKRLAFIARRSLLFAKIFVSIIPIIVIYPFLQKYFRKGIVIGAVKG